MRKIQLLCCTLLFAIGVSSASAFALLGPFAPWMPPIPGYVTNFNVLLPNIGAPMNIGQGYRWNIPTITYAYDQSFLNFFGSNGVAAVEAAIQILNDLPPSSAITLTNYPTNTKNGNGAASDMNLLDLKSSALCLLLQQVGLASPTSSMFCLNSNYDLSLEYQSLNLRNFDPYSQATSQTINGVLYEGVFGADSIGYPNDILTEDLTNLLFIILSYPVDPTVPGLIAVADGHAFATSGIYYTGLTVDDVGGLKYLLNTNNIALESLIPGVTGAGNNANNFVNRAFRPGVDKITFQRLQIDAITGQSFPFTNQYLDVYQTNGVFQQQTVQRIVTQPDIIFSAKYLSGSNLFYPAQISGTDNWMNNGAIGQDGPGVIQPPVKIIFNSLSQRLIDGGQGPNGGSFKLATWASFDDSTNISITYPAVASTNPQTILHLWLNYLPGSLTEIKKWNLNGASNTLFYLQGSTNLTTWSNVMTITNIGNDATFVDAATQPRYVQRFYRIVGQ